VEERGRGGEGELGRALASWAGGKRSGGGLVAVLGLKGERGEGVWESLLFFFKPLKFKLLFKLTFQTFEIELFSKHSKIFKTFLKAFKTSHKQIIKPCIQIMMHKHLLLLNY
jgi:hypothetical protein